MILGHSLEHWVHVDHECQKIVVAFVAVDAAAAAAAVAAVASAFVWVV